MINYIRRLFVILFTSNPYKVVPFNKLARYETGAPIDVAETVTSVLKKEQGDISCYVAPETFNQDFKKVIIKNEDRYISEGLFSGPERCLYSIGDAYIIGQTGFVYKKKIRAFIDESGKEWKGNLTRSSYANLIKMPAAQKLKGITISCLSIGADGGYYHFVHEVLPKLYFCRDIISYVDHILINGGGTVWKMKWLDCIGVDIDKIVWAPHPAHFECEQLLFTNRLVTDQQVSNWSLNALNSLLNNKPSKTSSQPGRKVLWISRKNAQSRTITWEDKLLQAFSFIEQVILEDLPLKNIIGLFKQATHVIGPHGAGFSNIFLCNPGTKILELFPDQKSYKPCYSRMSSISGLNHHIAAVNFTNEDDAEQGMAFLKDVLNKFVSNSNE